MPREYRTVKRYPTICLGTCGRLIRPSRAKLKDWPGTILLAGLGRCGPCRADMAHNGHARPPADLEATKASLEKYLARRPRSNSLKVVRL